MSSFPEVEQVLAQHPDTELAYVFGSVARGEAGADSDLDLAVRMAEEPLDAKRKINLIEELASATRRPVDLVDLRTVGEPLLGQVLSGERLIGTPEQHAALMTRHLLDEADFMPYVRRMQAERRARWMQ